MCIMSDIKMHIQNLDDISSGLADVHPGLVCRSIKQYGESGKRMPEE